jgi:hypothetical protein
MLFIGKRELLSEGKSVISGNREGGDEERE